MIAKNSLRLVLAVAVSLAAANALAQDAVKQSAENAAPSINLDHESMSFEDSLQFKISINQSSGSVLQLVESIRLIVPKLNIVVTENAGNYRLPEIQVSEVPIRGVLSLISVLTDNAVEVDFQPHLELEESEGNVVLISCQDGYNQEADLTVRVLNVKRLLETSDRDALLSALDEGYRMMGKETNQVEIKIHETTGLLFVKGNPAQLLIAESVIAEIEKSFADSPTINRDTQKPSLRLPNAASQVQ